MKSNPYKQEACSILNQHLANMQIFYLKLVKYQMVQMHLKWGRQSQVLDHLSVIVDQEIKITRRRLMEFKGIVIDNLREYMILTRLKLIPADQHSPKRLSEYLEDDLNQMMKAISQFPEMVLLDSEHMDNTYKIVEELKEAVSFFDDSYGHSKIKRKIPLGRVEMRG